MTAAAFDSWVERARNVPIERVIEQRGIRLNGKTDRNGPCPVCGGHDRFAINTRKRVWNCRGCQKGGDVIELVRFLDGSDFGEAIATLTSENLSTAAGRPQRGTEHDRSGHDDYERRKRGKASCLWRASQATTGTLVETYLASRGIALPQPATVRFLPPFKPDHRPAMVVAYGLPQEPEPGVLDIAEDAITAVQLTLLKADGTGKADIEPNKITIASPAGMPMVLAPMNDLLGLAICEGAQDALTIHAATGLGAWASGGASFMPKIAGAVPDYAEAVTVYAHADAAGQRGACELADALIARGIEVRVEGIAP